MAHLAPVAVWAVTLAGTVSFASRLRVFDQYFLGGWVAFPMQCAAVVGWALIITGNVPQ